MVGQNTLMFWCILRLRGSALRGREQVSPVTQGLGLVFLRAMREADNSAPPLLAEKCPEVCLCHNRNSRGPWCPFLDSFAICLSKS